MKPHEKQAYNWKKITRTPKRIQTAMHSQRYIVLQGGNIVHELPLLLSNAIEPCANQSCLQNIIQITTTRTTIRSNCITSNTVAVKNRVYERNKDMQALHKQALAINYKEDSFALRATQEVTPVEVTLPTSIY